VPPGKSSAFAFRGQNLGCFSCPHHVAWVEKMTLTSCDARVTGYGVVYEDENVTARRPQTPSHTPLRLCVRYLRDIFSLVQDIGFLRSPSGTAA